MRTAVLATKNLNKVKEIQQIMFPYEMNIQSLIDYPNISMPDETGITFEENAVLKAVFIAKRLNCMALADDSGLVVGALNGRPGIYSARFAGFNATTKENNQKLLLEMAKLPDEKRSAEFVCVIACASPLGKLWKFEGKVKGKIIKEERGKKGFGYDPLFVPEGFDKTFAEMEPAEKNKISHRYKAIYKFINELDSIFGSSKTLI